MFFLRDIFKWSFCGPFLGAFQSGNTKLMRTKMIWFNIIMITRFANKPQLPFYIENSIPNKNNEEEEQIFKV